MNKCSCWRAKQERSNKRNCKCKPLHAKLKVAGEATAG